MKIIKLIFLLYIGVAADCLDLINADTLNIDSLIIKYYGHFKTRLYPKVENSDQDWENSVHKKNISNCLKELKKYEPRCNMHILTYFNKDTSMAISNIEQLKLYKSIYLKITNPIILSEIEDFVCTFSGYFTEYDYHKKLIHEYSVPEITAEEFINSSKNNNSSDKIDLYVNYYHALYWAKDASDYDSLLIKTRKDPLLKLLEPYVKRDLQFPLKELDNDSLIGFMEKVTKLDNKNLLIIINCKRYIQILTKIESSIYERWRKIQEIKNENAIEKRKSDFDEQIRFLKNPVIPEMLKLIGRSLNEDEKQRTIYPKVVKFVDSLQTAK